MKPVIYLPVIYLLLLVSGTLFAAEGEKQGEKAPEPPKKPQLATGEEGPTQEDKGSSKLPTALSEKEWPAPRTADKRSKKIIAKYIKAIGGRKALLSLTDRYEKFTIKKHRPTGVTKAVFEHYLKRESAKDARWAPDVQMVRADWHMGEDIQVAGQTLDVVQLYNGKTGKGWTKMMGYVSPLKSNMIQMLVYDKYVDDPFMHWKQDGYAVRYRGEGEVDAHPCEVIDMYHNIGKQKFRYFLDKESDLLRKKQWISQSRKGKVQNELYYMEWRKVKNLENREQAFLFPFRKEKLSNGDLVMETEYKELRLNGGISDKLFTRPKGPVFKKRVGSQPKKKDKEKTKKPPWLKRKKRATPGESGSQAKPEATEQAKEGKNAPAQPESKKSSSTEPGSGKEKSTSESK